MRRAVAASAVLLVFGGLGLFLFGVLRFRSLMDAWTDESWEVAERSCRPGETFTVLRKRRIGGKTSYNYYCVDAAGNRRVPRDEVDAASPMRRATTWAPMAGGTAAFLGGIALVRLATRLPEKRRR